jgi:hypothetical protein
VTHARLRRILGVLWLAGVGAALYIAVFHRELVGVAIGEGAICAIYIFLGDWVLRRA